MPICTNRLLSFGAEANRENGASVGEGEIQRVSPPDLGFIYQYVYKFTLGLTMGTSSHSESGSQGPRTPGRTRSGKMGIRPEWRSPPGQQTLAVQTVHSRASNTSPHKQRIGFVYPCKAWNARPFGFVYPRWVRLPKAAQTTLHFKLGSPKGLCEKVRGHAPRR
jgi:hypothetical protein